MKTEKQWFGLFHRHHFNHFTWSKVRTGWLPELYCACGERRIPSTVRALKRKDPELKQAIARYL